MIKYNTRKNRHTVDHNYKFGDNIMLTKQTAYKYETPYTGPFVIKRFWDNGTVSLKNGATDIRYNIHSFSYINLIIKMKILVQKYV